MLRKNEDATGWDEGGCLLRGAALAEAEEKLKQRREDLSEGELFYIQASVALQDREQKHKERVKRHTVFAYVVAGISILALGLLIQWQMAEKPWKLREEEWRRCYQWRKSEKGNWQGTTRNLSSERDLWNKEMSDSCEGLLGGDGSISPLQIPSN